MNRFFALAIFVSLALLLLPDVGELWSAIGAAIAIALVFFGIERFAADLDARRTDREPTHLVGDIYQHLETIDIHKAADLARHLMSRYHITPKE